jgi:hypothetical protein
MEEEMGRICSMYEEVRNACRILVRKCEGKRPFRRHMYRWENNIKMDLKETGWEGLDWTHLAQNRVRW